MGKLKNEKGEELIAAVSETDERCQLEQVGRNPDGRKGSQAMPDNGCQIVNLNGHNSCKCLSVF